MKFSLLAIALVSAVAASPVEKRAIDEMKLCDNANYGGLCRTWRGVNTGVCVNLDLDINDKVSSAWHSPGHSCRYWKDTGCSGDSVGGTEDNIPDFGAIGFNDRVTSWRCS